MDEDYGTELANAQADYQYYEEHDMCPSCLTKYKENGDCWCED